ncbi:MAG: hypothetical protein WCP28_01990 [Actinomycetes bacterium]
MPYLIGFAPWLAYFILSASNYPTRHTLVLAAWVGLALSGILIASSVKRHRVSSLEVGGLIFFPMILVVTLVAPPDVTDLWAAALPLAALTTSVGVGILLGRPFTLTYQKQETPEVMWTDPRFIAVCRRLAVGWLVGLAAMTASAVISVFFATTSLEAIIFDWVIPAIIAIGVVRWELNQLDSARVAGAARVSARLSTAIEAGDPILGFLDHVSARVSRARAHALFNSLRSLGLVEVWKMTDYGPFISGAVRLGNLNLEIVGTDSVHGQYPSQWITFAPTSLSGLLPELDRRKIAHGATDTRKTGNLDIYTQVDLPALTQRHFSIQLCATFTTLRTVAPKAPWNLGQVIEVTDVRISTTKAFLPNWRALAAPMSAGAPMEFTEGPRVTLTQGDTNTVGAVVIRVADVRAAVKAFLSAGLHVDGTRVAIGTLTLELSPGPARL